MLLLGLGAGPTCAQPSAEEIARAVRDLGSPKFTLREKASALLWAAGQEGELALLRTLPKGDLEAVRRAQRILDKFRWGIYPDTPKEILALVTKFRSGTEPDKITVLRELFGRGPTQYRLIARLLSAEVGRTGRTNVGPAALGNDLMVALQARLRKHAFAELEELLAIRLTSGEEKPVRDYALCLLLNGNLERAIPYYDGHARLPEGKRAAVILTHLHRAKGDLSAARQAAELSGEAELLQMILAEQGDWKTLSARAEQLVGEDGLDDYKAVSHRLAGNGPGFEASVAALVKTARAKKPDDGTLWWEAKSLFLNDRPAEALAILDGGNDFAMPFNVLVRQHRHGEALRLLERYRSHDGEHTSWAAIHRAKLLLRLGEKEAACKVLDGVRAQIEERFFPWLHTALLRAERDAGREAEARQLWARLLRRGLPPDGKQPGGPSWTAASYAEHLLSAVLDLEHSGVPIWWRFLRARHSEPMFLGWRFPEDPLITLGRLRSLFDGKLDKAEFAALVRAAKEAALKRPEAMLLRQKAAKLQQPGAGPDEWLQGLIETCRRAGREDLLRECLEASVEVGGSRASFTELAKFLLGKQLWAEAAEVCARARKLHPDDPVLTLLHGHAQTRAGRVAEGRQLEELAHWLPLADDAARHELGKALADLGRHDEARREFTLVTRSGFRRSWYMRNAWRHLSQYALREGDFLKAAACWEIWYLGVIGRGSFFLEDEPYVTVPHRLHLWRGRGLLARGDLAGARAEIALCERVLPGEAETAQTFVPALTTAGHRREADALFERTFDYWRSLCKEHPRSAKFHNSLAWLAARCRRQLDAGLGHGRAAVRLGPDNPSYLDTLAEVHFQRGESAEAVRLIRRCIELAPGKDYYRNQLKRFEAGDRSVEVPR
jgi:tetratricopeptide (TPR) repeat protein